MFPGPLKIIQLLQIFLFDVWQHVCHGIRVVVVHLQVNADSDGKHPMHVVVIVHRQTELFQIVAALRSAGGFAGLLDGR